MAVSALGLGTWPSLDEFPLGQCTLFLTYQASVLREGAFGALGWSTGEKYP